MTRPRISSAAVSWSVELPVMAKAMLTPPRTGSRTHATGSVGARARPIENAPAAIPRRASRGVFGCLALDAIINAPASDPAPKRASMTPYVPASPWKVRLAMRGSRTTKFQANRNVIAMVRRGSRSSGVCHA
jgi:hypothetical protein